LAVSVSQGLYSVDQVTHLEGRHALWKYKLFDDFVKALNSMKLTSIQIFVHSDMAEYEKYE
jgi:hypothetical protein